MAKKFVVFSDNNSFLIYFLFHDENDRRICLPGVSITNKFANEKEFHWRIFSLTSSVHYALVPHLTVFSENFFSSGKKVDLEILQRGCTAPWRGTIR
jgi:hypothetical protein